MTDTVQRVQRAAPAMNARVRKPELSEAELAQVHAELHAAIERARHTLEWTEILLLLAQQRVNEGTKGTSVSAFDTPPD